MLLLKSKKCGNPGLCLLLIITLCLQATGCQNDVVCEDLTSANLRAGFYRISASGQESVVTIDSISIYGAGRPDTLIYNNQKSAARIELPLDPSRDETTFILVFPGSYTDTITTIYSRELTLLDIECGFAMFYDLKKVLHTSDLIDSCMVMISTVSGSRDEHIKIYISTPSDR